VTQRQSASRRRLLSGGTRPLLILGLAWLGALLWAARSSIRDAGDPLTAVISAALALPGVIAASVLAGAATGLTLAEWWSAHRGGGRGIRVLAGAVGGLAVGLVGGTLILFGYGHRSSIVVLAAAVLVASAVGGTAAGLLPIEIVSAGLAATVGAFFVDVLVSMFQGRLADAFGAGTSAPSELHAATRVALTQSLLGGVVAGLVAYLYLRRRGDRRFPAYLAAGATPGLLLLLAEVVIRIGGAQLMGMAGRISTADRAVLSYFGTTRIDHAMVVLFVGAIIALLAFGRTVQSRS
jgi:hypothetical protein